MPDITTSETDSAVMKTYARFPGAIVRGEGVYLFDADGRRYLDFYAGIAVNSLGHCHPHLVAKLKEQMETLWHVSNVFRIEPQEKLAKRLCANSFADVAFFTNSGVESIEGLVKLARRYQSASGHPERWRVITVEGAFHGRSLATIAAANNPKYLDGFGPKVDGFDNVPFGNMNEVRNAITQETAAILVEPIQGEGGIRPADMQYLRDLRAAADEFGLLLILDEIQSGNGRTGKMWAHEWADIKPDAIATAKGLGGGFPVGAIMATHEAAKGMVPGVHGTTFGGNPLAMAAANAVLDVLQEDGFLDQVVRMADLLRGRLEKLVADNDHVFAEIRGGGLMLGLRCVDGVSNGDVINALRAVGLLTVGAGENVVRLLPPLTITEDHIDEALACLNQVAESWGK